MKLHHIGIVVNTISRHGLPIVQSLGLDPLSPVIHDPAQRVYVQFWGTGSDVSIELIEPAAGGSPVKQFVDKGGGLGHLCFEVGDIEASVREAEAKGAIPVQSPIPAAAFEGRRIAFLFYRGVGLVEFVEAERVKAGSMEAADL